MSDGVHSATTTIALSRARAAAAARDGDDSPLSTS
jgi:hypothetical protein